MLNVFETFLPQLLLYPNPTDPLNGEAAALLMREPEAYNAKVKGGQRILRDGSIVEIWSICLTLFLRADYVCYSKTTTEI